jgi:hypothetical protein
VCVTGSPGSGKSALFAELHHRLPGRRVGLVLATAAGDTPHGGRVDATLRRWIGELAAFLASPSPISDGATPDDVESMFYRLLRQASLATRVVVLVDALDQFEPTPRGTHVTWLRQRSWPDNVALVVTALPCTAVKALEAWPAIAHLEIPELTAEDAAAIAKAVWRRYHREISPDVVRVLVTKPNPSGERASGNPLWLTLALEQLNLLDADDFSRAQRDYGGTPAERLNALVLDTASRMPGDVEGLYRWLLDRNEKVFGAAASRSFSVAMALSRHGWRDADLAGIMRRLASLLMPAAEPPPVDELHQAALRRGFRAHVIRRGEWGLLDFGHAQMRRAVDDRYLADEGRRRGVHARVADYLETLQAGDPVVGSERLWQLLCARDAGRAFAAWRMFQANLWHGLMTPVMLLLAVFSLGAGISQTPLGRTLGARVGGRLDARVTWVIGHVFRSWGPTRSRRTGKR